MDVVSWLLAKKYTDNSLIGMGALKGAPCKVKSVVKADGMTTVTLSWEDDNGVSHDTEFYVKDGVTKWVSKTQYAVGDLVIYNDVLYYCEVANNDTTFDSSKWSAVSGGGVADCDYYIVELLTDLPSDLTVNDRKIYFVLQDKAFHLWDGTSWSVITTDVNIRELTQAQYDALTPAEKMNGTIYFVTDAEGGGGGSGELTNPITAAITVGGISSGTQYPVGTSLESIFSDLLEPTLYPTLTAPTVSMSATGSKLLEKGETPTVTFTITFNRGSINPAYGTDGKRAGAANGYSLNGGTSQAGNTFSVTVDETNKTYQGAVSYDAGPQPKDSKDNDYMAPLPAGTLNTNTITYEFVNAIWANTVNITSVDKLSLTSKSTKQRDMQFPPQTVANPEVFDIPASWTVTAVQVKNDLSGVFEDASTQFTVTSTTHDDAGGVSTNYNRYTFNMGFSTGSRTVRVKWS